MEQTLVLDGNGGRKILLPTGNLISVPRLIINDAEVTEFDFSASGWIELRSGVFPHRASCVEVTINHGFADAPVVEHLIQSMATRARMSPAGNIINQRAGSQSVTFASSGGEVASLPLLASEKELLAPYKLNWGPAI